MHNRLLPIILLVAFTSAAQDNDTKTVRKLIGADVKELPPQKSYPYSSCDSRCTIEPSLTLVNDTSGVHLQNEFLLFRGVIHSRNGSERQKFIRTDYVSVAEFEAFQQYVRDSMAREMLYAYLESDEEAVKFIRYDKKKPLTKPNGKTIPANTAERELNRLSYPLSRNEDILYDKPYRMPILADLYLPVPDRFYRQRDFDQRKWYYSYTDTGSTPCITSLYCDQYSWAAASTARRDAFAVLGELYPQLEKNSPAIGLTGMQAAAFCRWKQEQLQQECDQKGIRCTIVVTLPTLEDQQSLHVADPAFKIPERDYTQQWHINAGDYKRFIEHARDSLLRETLYQGLQEHTDALRLLRFRHFYFDEVEMRDIDPSEQIQNRHFFSLNYRAKIRKNDPEVRALMDSLFRTPAYRSPAYVYQWMDAWSRSFTGTLIPAVSYEGKEKLALLIPGSVAPNVPPGKDMNMDVIGPSGYAGGVRAHKSITRFFITEDISILPDPAFPVETQGGKALVKGISYAQALAFYHWKYPTWKAVEGQSWQEFVLPTAEQFNRIQQGEQITVPASTIPYPTPLFRYVVHVY